MLPGRRGEEAVAVEIPVYREERPAGALRLRREGERTAVEMECALDRSGLFRGFLRCSRGEVGLGVLEPKGERLVLRRMLLNGELEPLGRPMSGEMRLSFPFREAGRWRSAAPGEPLLADRALQKELDGTAGVLWRREGGGRYLAVPFRAGGPFPLTALFCFARIREIDGGTYAVFRLDSHGNPQL